MALWQCQAFHPPHADHMYEVLLTYFPYRISIIPLDTFVYASAKTNAATQFYLHSS